MILQRHPPTHARPFTAGHRGPPIRVGTKCGRGSSHMAPRTIKETKSGDTSNSQSQKGFRGEIIAELKRENVSALYCFATATIGVLYELAGQKRARGKIRSAFEAMQRDDRFLEHSVQGAIYICDATTVIDLSRALHHALETCAKEATNKEMWQDLLSKLMDHTHSDTLTFDIVALELLDN